MNSQKIIRFIQIIVGITSAYKSVNKVINRHGSVGVVDIAQGKSIEAEQKKDLLTNGLAIALFGGGLYLMMKNAQPDSGK